MASAEEAGRWVGFPVMSPKIRLSGGTEAAGRQRPRAAAGCHEHRQAGAGLGAWFDDGAADEAAIAGVERALHGVGMAALKEPMVGAGAKQGQGRQERQRGDHEAG
jgi:hypothetical protein